MASVRRPSDDTDFCYSPIFNDRKALISNDETMYKLLKVDTKNITQPAPYHAASLPSLKMFSGVLYPFYLSLKGQQHKIFSLCNFYELIPYGPVAS
jgi:hypothetical protein